MKVFRPLVVILLAVAPLAPAPTQEVTPVPLSVERASELATAASPLLVRRQRAVDDARDALGLPAYRDALSLTLAGDIEGTTATDFSSDGSATLALDVDLLPQLTLTGSLVARADGPSGPDAPPTDEEPQSLDASGDARSAPLTASLDLRFTPLADAGRRARDELSLARAVAALERDAREVSFEAIALLVESASLQAETPLAEQRVTLAEARLASTEALAVRDRATQEEVQSARDSERSARQALARHTIALRQAIARLSRALGIPADAFVVPSLSELASATDVATITAALETLDPQQAIAASPSLVSAQHDLQEARINESATLRFSPRITATAGVDAPEFAWSLGVSIQMSTADWDGEAKRQSIEEVTFAEAALEAERTSAELSLEMALVDVRIALEEIEAAAQALALAERDLAEADFRFERGDITRIALDAAELARDEAEVSLARARTTLLTRWYRVELLQF